MKIIIDLVNVNRERLREDNGDLEALAESLTKFGQLEPIILDKSNNLIAGFRRYSAARMCGWREIEVAYQGELSELQAREIELEENVQRKDMTWQEKVNALAELDKLKSIDNPNWTQAQTGAVAGVARQRVNEAIQLSKMMALFPEIAEAKSLAQANSWMQAKAGLVTRRMDVDASVEYLDIEPKLILGDSVEVIKTLPDKFIDAIITDPPFGIDYDRRSEGEVGTLSSYTDDKDSYLRLLSMAPDLYRVVKPNGWLVWFLGISWYEKARDTFRAAGFTVDEIPIIWNRSGGRTFTTRPDRYFTRGYDIALHCIKGNPQVVQRGKSNVITIDPVSQSERELLVERPVELYAELIRRLTLPGELVADFFCGSGSCPAAAASLGRDFLAVEQSTERRAFALTKIKSYIPTKED